MAGMLWVTDREPGVRQLFAELLPDAEVLPPDELHARLALGQRPDGLVIDGTQLLELIPAIRDELLTLPRLLICTGLPLISLPPSVVSRPTVAALAKPFCVDDLGAACDWVRDGLAVRRHGVHRPPPSSGGVGAQLAASRSAEAPPIIDR